MSDANRLDLQLPSNKFHHTLFQLKTIYLNLNISARVCVCVWECVYLFYIINIIIVIIIITN